MEEVILETFLDMLQFNSTLLESVHLFLIYINNIWSI